MSRVFDTGARDRGLIPGRVIPKTIKIVLDAALLNTQHYKVRIKDKVEQIQGKEWRPPLHLGVVAIEKVAFGLPSTKVTNQLYQRNLQLKRTEFLLRLTATMLR